MASTCSRTTRIARSSRTRTPRTTFRRLSTSPPSSCGSTPPPCARSPTRTTGARGTQDACLARRRPPSPATRGMAGVIASGDDWMKRVGIDIGGTFTDLVVVDEESGAVARTKTPTIPRAPEEGFLRAVEEQGIDLDEVSHFLHGTTLVTNLIIERAGATVGLITTKGFRDVLEMQRSFKKDQFDLQYDKPKPFVPRYLRLEVDERVDHRGNILKPVDPAEVRA